MNRHLAQALGATALGALLLQPVTSMADPPMHAHNENSAQHRGFTVQGDRRGDDRRDDGRHDRRYDDRHRDWRHWEPQHHYPRRGLVVHRVPPQHRVVHHHGHRYYYSHGTWYRPHGARYVVVDPPLGLVVSFLPHFGNTVYFGGIPHHRAGSVYYVWNPRLRGYVVTDRPHRRW